MAVSASPGGVTGGRRQIQRNKFRSACWPLGRGCVCRRVCLSEKVEPRLNAAYVRRSSRKLPAVGQAASRGRAVSSNNQRTKRDTPKRRTNTELSPQPSRHGTRRGLLIGMVDTDVRRPKTDGTTNATNRSPGQAPPPPPTHPGRRFTKRTTKQPIVIAGA